jgi:hypothetical protein
MGGIYRCCGLGFPSRELIWATMGCGGLSTPSQRFHPHRVCVD